MLFSEKTITSGFQIKICSMSTSLPVPLEETFSTTATLLAIMSITPLWYPPLASTLRPFSPVT